jgi:hypothetical protein|nr:MAG TPA: hypothetical protein [Caudoviricetes sp.]
MNEQESRKLTPKLIFVGYGIPLREFLKIKEKPSRAQTINVRELLDEERDRLSDEANRGEWDTLPNEMKYLKRKQYDTLLSYLTLLDQLAKCEAKTEELKRRNEL